MISIIFVVVVIEIFLFYLTTYVSLKNHFIILEGKVIIMTYILTLSNEFLWQHFCQVPIVVNSRSGYNSFLDRLYGKFVGDDRTMKNSH